MKKNNLLICPKCELEGKTSILGEITSDGKLSVMRFHQSFTNIISNNFEVECGACGEKVFYRNKPEQNETNISYIGTARIPWQSFIGYIKAI